MCVCVFERVGLSVSWVAVAFTLGSLAMVPVYENAESIVAVMQQLNGLYSMPVLAAFIAAVLFAGIAPWAVRIGLVFGAALYAVFTFVWSPLHYIHLMAITLVASVALMWVLGRVLPRRNAEAPRAIG